MRTKPILRYSSYLFFLCASFALGALFFVVHNKCINFSVLEHYNPGSPSILLDDQGNEWARFQLDRRHPIKLEQMPDHLIKAFIAAEDWSFFTHSGLSYKGILRSILVNIYHGRRVQGASTITQQLVRLLFFEANKTFTRKLKEQLFALLVERQFTKEQILETYLNHVCFGCGIYGVEAACQRFWGKHAYDISLDESAVLAAIMRSPRRYCPITHPLSAQRRRNVVLNSMRKLRFINEEQYQQATQVVVEVRQPDATGMAPHLKETMRIFLEDMVGKATLYTGGMTIQTTLNQDIQQKAERSFHEQMMQLRENLFSDVDGALISVDTKTGAIKSLIGGFSFAVSQFNRALQARRQVGSIFKPILYASAIDVGMSFVDTDIDEEFHMKQGGTTWSPNNFNMKFAGQMTLANALSRSNNIIAIKTLLKVGIPKVISAAKACHLRGPFPPYPSLALGCVDATLKEMAGMFNIFANDGVYVQPHYIKWVKNKWGTKIWKYASAKERVFSSRVTGQVSKALSLGLQRVRWMMPQKWVDGDAISKTGTTNDSRTCWFVGSTPELTTAVYVGCDDNRSMGRNVYPIRTTFPIWMGLNRELKLTQKKFMYDPSLREVLIDEKTGELVSSRGRGIIEILV